MNLTSNAKRTAALLVGLLICTSLTAALSAAGTVRTRQTMGELIGAHRSDARTQIWIVFRGPDCGLSSELIQALNRIDSARAVEVHGVMMFSPLDSAAQRELSKSLGISFNMIYDVDGVWRAALFREKQRSPVIYFRDGVALTGGVSAAFMKQFAALSLTDVPLEREK